MAKRAVPPESTQTNSGGPSPLPESIRHGMEVTMGADFSQVRIHTGAHVQGIGAVAYTQGDDIHFASGAYQPHTDDGLRLIGHELAHVVQQRAGAKIPKLPAGTVDTTDSAPPVSGE
jgi:hypothetical protein